MTQAIDAKTLRRDDAEKIENVWFFASLRRSVFALNRSSPQSQPFRAGSRRDSDRSLSLAYEETPSFRRGPIRENDFSRSREETEFFNVRDFRKKSILYRKTDLGKRALALCKALVFFYLLGHSNILLGTGASELDPVLAQIVSKNCVVDTKQIAIPNYPKAFNPSLIPYQDGYLLSFRVRKKLSHKARERKHRVDASYIGVAELDKEFNSSTKTVQLLNIVSHSPQVSETAEDARLLNVGNRIFIFFNDLPLSQASGGYAIYFGELIKEHEKFVLKEPAKLLKYANAVQIEKNWSPFVSGGKFYVIYSDQPRIILEVDIHTGNCSEVTRTPPNWNWNWGVVRGGTPAYLVDDKFITFFHSSFPAIATKKAKNPRNYAMGAYIFDKDPPFSIHAATSEPLGELKDYMQNNPRKVIFPGGVVIKEDVLHVAWGKDDRELYITTFNKKMLLGSMKEK